MIFICQITIYRIQIILVNLYDFIPLVCDVRKYATTVFNAMLHMDEENSRTRDKSAKFCNRKCDVTPYFLKKRGL